MEKPVVIGEGTYGCVHKPTLKCKDNPNVDYTDKISKLMKDKDADIELTEYDAIDRVDADHQFHLKRPTKCIPKLSPSYLANCKLLDKSDLTQLRLLIMEDGGQDLAKFVASKPPKEDAENAIIQFHNVCQGLLVLHDNGMIHHDLKPQNVVFNRIKKIMNFIDFGYMTTRQRILHDSRASMNGHTIPHWSFPPEAPLLNKSFYEDVVRLRSTDIQRTTELIWTKYVKPHTVQLLKVVFINEQDGLEILYEQFTEFIETGCIAGNYERILNRSTLTIDVFGIGLTLLFFVGRIRRHLTKTLQKQLVDLCWSALNFNVLKRITISEFITTYERILTDSGLLVQHGYEIQNHKLSEIVEPVVATEKQIVEKSVVASEEPIVALEEPVVEKSVVDRCGPNKELNPRTNRCTKRCKSGYNRDDKFVCRKACLEGKERNPTTGRCVLRCKENEIRNAKFRCTKKKRA